VSTTAAQRAIPWLLAVAFFMEALDTTILNTALPTIAAALGVAPLGTKAALTSYTLSLAVFIPISGWLADRFGTRLVFSAAIALFAIGSLACGLSNSIHTLVACRVLQGCGGAMMVPVGRLTMVRTFPRGELVRAMAFVTIPALVGPMLGPLAGGLIVKYLHWRMIFFVNVPIALAAEVFAYRLLPDLRAAHPEPLDTLGFVLFGVGVALLSYVLEVFGEHSMGGRAIIALLAVSLLLIAAYVRHALRPGARPLLRLDLFRLRTFRAAVLGGFITRIAIGGMPFLLPLLYQVGFGLSPVASGLLLMPQFLAAMALRSALPRILARFGYRRVLLTNTFAVGMVIALFATLGAHTPWPLIVTLALAFGSFSALQYTSMNTLVYADVADEATSMASTIASTGQQMSMSFGVATASLVTALFIPDRTHAAPHELVRGLHHAFLLLGALTVLSAAVFRSLSENDGANVSRHATKPVLESAGA
jgi:EmrB/QacA subfamily drug resistance transporter